MIRTFILIFTATAVAAAQTAPPARPAFGDGLKQNSEKLRQYTWKRRLDITIKGRSVQRLESVRYVDGKLESTPLDTPQRAGGQQQGRGLRGMIVRQEVAKKKDEMKKEVAQLRALLDQYTPGSPSVRAALEKGTISHDGSGADATVKVQASGVIQPGDSLAFIWSVADRRPRRLEIHSALDKKPVQMTVEFTSLPEGPFYRAHTVLAAPGKNLNVNIDTFDYVRSGKPQ